MYELKNLQRRYMSWQWQMMQTLRGTDMSFQNWHEKFEEFWASTQKPSNLHFNA